MKCFTLGSTRTSSNNTGYSGAILTPKTLKKTYISNIGTLVIMMVFGLAMLMPSKMKSQTYPGFLDRNVLGTNSGESLDWEDIWRLQEGLANAPLPPGSITTDILFDATAPDQIFTGGGTKDHLPINGPNASKSWQWKDSDGSSSDKTDIREGGAILIGDELYFFGNKFAFNGTTTIGFWFFQDIVGQIPGGRFSGEHTVDDILVVADISQGGVVGVIDAYRWVGEGAGTLPNSTKSFVKIATDAGDLTAVVNIIAQPTPWPHQSKAVAANIMPPITFFEGFLDLGELFPNKSFCFSSVLVETRSSNPVNSILEDFTAGAFNVQPTVSVEDLTKCEGDALGTLTAIADGGVPPLTYAWTVPQGASDPGNVASFIPTVAGTYSVIVSGQGIGGGTCPSEPDSAEVIINPKPDAGISTDGVCDGEDSVFTATPNDGDNYLFFEDVNDDGVYDAGDDGASLQDGASDTYTAAHANGTKIGVVVTYENEDADDCSDTAVTTTVVYDNPDAGISTEGVCDGEDSVFTATPNDGDNYLFFEDVNDDGVYDAGDDGASLQDGTSDTYTGAHANGTKIGVVVTYENEDANCSDTAVTTTVVYDDPTCSASNEGPICQGTAVGLSEDGGDAVSWLWSSNGAATFDDATSRTPIASGAVNGEIFTVEITDDNGCTSSCTTTVTVIICVEEGCTLGYWKNHTDQWCDAYQTCTLYNSIFTASTLDPNLTLLQALNLMGNTDGENLARQSVAALLNICSDGVSYPEFATVEALVIYVNAAFASGGVNAAGSHLDFLNNSGCPLGGSRAFTGEDVCPEPDGLRSSLSSTAVITADANLLSAYPVPFKETLNVKYDFDYSSAASIQIFDLQGRLLRSYKEANATKGNVSQLSIDFRTQPNQVYILKVTTDRDVFTKKIISDK